MQRRVSSKVYTAALKPETIPGQYVLPSADNEVQYPMLPRERDRSEKRLCLLLCTLFQGITKPNCTVSTSNPLSLSGDKRVNAVSAGQV